MNVNQYTGFVRWMFKSFGEAVARKNREFRNLMVNEFWLSFLLWIILTAILMIPVGLTALYFLEPASGYVQIAMRIYLGVAIAYFAGTGFNIMYENYCHEQQQIIERLKGQ